MKANMNWEHEITSRYHLSPLYNSWQEWKECDVKNNICDRISEEMLEQCRSILWKNKAVFDYVKNGNEQMGAFAIYISDSISQINEINEDGDNLLNIAMRSCSPAFCRFLYTKGTQIYCENNMGESLLDIARKCNKIASFNLLFDEMRDEELFHPYFSSPFRTLSYNGKRNFDWSNLEQHTIVEQKPLQSSLISSSTNQDI